MSTDADLIDPLEARLLPRPGPGLRVGLVVPQSGALGLTGPSALDAALLARHEVEAAEILRDRRLELVLVDGGRPPSEVAAEVGALCRAGGLDVVTGFHTSDVHRAVERTVAGVVPYVFTPPHEGGTRRPGVVCLGADPVRQLGRAVAWISHRHGVRRWALVGNDYIWPRAVHAAARRMVAADGAEVALEQLTPLGRVPDDLDRLLDALRRSRADALLLSLVGRDLAVFNAALRRAGLHTRLVRLSGALEENGLLALGGDDTGTLYSAMPSFSSLADECRVGLAERYHGLHGPQAPVLDAYATGVYAGVRLVASLAADDLLSPHDVVEASRRRRPALAGEVHLGRAEGLQFEVVRTA